MTSTYFAACTLGLEGSLAQEIRSFGADGVSELRGGVTFRGDLLLGYRACLWSRTAIRVQEELIRGPVHSEDGLYDLARSVDWSKVSHPRLTLAVDATTKDGPVPHAGFAALVVKDAVADWWRDRVGRRPSVDRDRPDVPLKLVIRGTDAILYRDLAGPSLHKRGYRPVQVKSPLNESTAAGVLMLAGFTGHERLVDPFCGSGTFLIEAAWIACDRAPNLDRNFPFFRWPDWDGKSWAALDAEARNRIRKPPEELRLLGSDHHPGALGIARAAIVAAEMDSWISVVQSDVADLRPSFKPNLVVTNPPWGVRIGEGEDLSGAWQKLGRFLREQASNSQAFVLSGDPEITRNLGLRAERRIPIRVGPIDCRLLHYAIHDRQETPSDPDTSPAEPPAP